MNTKSGMVEIPCDWCKNAPDFKSDRKAKYFIITGQLNLNEPFREWFICREHLDVMEHQDAFSVEVRAHVRIRVDAWEIKELTPKLVQRWAMR